MVWGFFLIYLGEISKHIFFTFLFSFLSYWRKSLFQKIQKTLPTDIKFFQTTLLFWEENVLKEKDDNTKKRTNFTITFLSPDLFLMMSIMRPSAPILVCSQQLLVPWYLLWCTYFIYEQYCYSDLLFMLSGGHYSEVQHLWFHFWWRGKVITELWAYHTQGYYKTWNTTKFSKFF